MMRVICCHCMSKISFSFSEEKTCKEHKWTLLFVILIYIYKFCFFLKFAHFTFFFTPIIAMNRFFFLLSFTVLSYGVQKFWSGFQLLHIFFNWFLFELVCVCACFLFSTRYFLHFLLIRSTCVVKNYTYSQWKNQKKMYWK